MKKVLFIRVILMITLILLLPDSLFCKQPADEASIDPLTKEDIFFELELFADTITLINANYVEDVKPKEMIYGALDGMLSSLDSHSGFLTPEEFKELRTDAIGEFGGLGIRVTIRDNVLTVVSPLEDTPAHKAGIMPGDKIIRVGDESTKNFTLDDAVKRMRGVPGSEVKLVIIREGEKKLLDFTIKRAIIKIKSIKEAKMLNNKIGYIRISDFQQKTARDLDKSLKQLLKKRMKYLILDLRNNPGGLLDSAVSVSEKFLKKGKLIVYTRGRIEQQTADFKSGAFRPYTSFPMVILVNKGSASASEIVAGALADNRRAVIVGGRTFGKGSVQTVIPMKDGSALRLTTSLYYTPSGKVIHKKGIAPDLEVEITESDIEEKRDSQLQAAIELLKDRERYKGLLNS